MKTYVKICISFGVIFTFFILSYIFILKINQKKPENLEVNVKPDTYEKMSKCENNNCQIEYEENIIPKIYTNIPPPQEFPRYVERDYIITRPLYRRPRRRAIFKALAQTKDEIKKDFRTYSKLK